MKNNTNSKPAIISIVGISGSGKTTLLEKLIRELTTLGLRLATIKHSCHPHPLDVKGKDSWRHKNAGAVKTLFVGPKMLQLVADIEVEAEPTPEELAEKYLGNVELVLIEGFQKSGTKKLEVLRSAHSKKPKFKKEDGLIALITDIPRADIAELAEDVKIIKLDDVSGVAKFILEYLKITPALA